MIDPTLIPETPDKWYLALPPTGALFDEYATKLHTGKVASWNYADKARREDMLQTLANGCVAQANNSVPRDMPQRFEEVKKQGTDMFNNIAARLAQTAQWFEGVRNASYRLGCEPGEVMYRLMGLPLEDAKLMFARGVAPSAVAIALGYRGESDEDLQALLETYTPLFLPLPPEEEAAMLAAQPPPQLSKQAQPRITARPGKVPQPKKVGKSRRI